MFKNEYWKRERFKKAKKREYMSEPSIFAFFLKS